MDDISNAMSHTGGIPVDVIGFLNPVQTNPVQKSQNLDLRNTKRSLLKDSVESLNLDLRVEDPFCLI